LHTFGLFWGLFLFVTCFVTSVDAADSSSEQIERTFKQLIASFQSNDYAAFQKIAKGMPVDFSVRDFTKLHRLLHSFGPLQRSERAAKDAKEGDKKGVLYRLFYPSAQIHLMLAFQDGQLTRFRFGGRALEERIRALEEEAKRKIALIDFEILNNAGFPHLQSGPLPAGTLAYRMKLSGLKPKAGFLRARVDIHLRHEDAPPMILQTGKPQTIRLPPTVIQPVWTLQGKITIHKAGRYTLILIATDENNGEIARLEHSLSIQTK
jgi:hypothetical protein